MFWFHSGDLRAHFSLFRKSIKAATRGAKNLCAFLCLCELKKISNGQRSCQYLDVVTETENGGLKENRAKKSRETLSKKQENSKRENT